MLFMQSSELPTTAYCACKKPGSRRNSNKIIFDFKTILTELLKPDFSNLPEIAGGGGGKEIY